MCQQYLCRMGTDDLLSRRSARHAEAKQVIAEKAAALLRPNTTLFLDSGSTATAVARCIPDQPMLIYTSGLSCAMELADGGERRLTPKADVYAVGKLMHCLLDQNILEALRKGWYSDLKKELKAPTLNASGINDPQLTPAVQKSQDRILSGAAEIKPEKRSSVQEMMEQVMQLYRKIEPPAWQMSLGLLQLNGDEVLGRDKDIKKIEAKMR